MLNPAGMDVENWQASGIPPEFAEKQVQVLETLSAHGGDCHLHLHALCTGNTPRLASTWPGLKLGSMLCQFDLRCPQLTVKEVHLRWQLPQQALRRVLSLPLKENRQPTLTPSLSMRILTENGRFWALGKLIGEKIEASKAIPYILGVQSATLANLKSFCASLATYGGLRFSTCPGSPRKQLRPYPPRSRSN